MDPLIPTDLVDLLASARAVTVLTGAGTSAESGVPTFRDAQTGLWAQYDPEQLATPQAFRKDPRLVWEWYAWRRSIVAGAKPNPGHMALARLAEAIPHLTLITQNVDGLHQQAGNKNVIELHGNIMRTKCFDCERLVDEINDVETIPPRCPHCGGPLRPDVVWFGENLSLDVISSAFAASRDCDLFFSIGTSSLVQPAAALPIEAIDAGIPVVEINTQRTPLTRYVNFALVGPSGIILPQLVKEVWSV